MHGHKVPLGVTLNAAGVTSLPSSVRCAMVNDEIVTIRTMKFQDNSRIYNEIYTFL